MRHVIMHVSFMIVAVADKSPPAIDGDPDFQQDPIGPEPIDTLVGKTKYNRQQLDSIAMSKVIAWKYNPPKELAKPLNPPEQK